MRHRLALPAAATALALTLVACGSDDAPEASGSSTAAGSTSLENVTVTGGDEKTAPKVTIATAPLNVAKLSTKVLTEGKGTATAKDDIVLVDYLFFNGKDGATIDSNYEKEPVGFDTGDAQLIAGLRTALTGVKPGSRVLVAIPPADGFGEQGNSQINVSGTDTIGFVLDVKSTTKALPVAEGTAVKAKSGLPEVAFNEGKPATITMPKGKPPAKLVVQPLIAGKGAVVKKGQTVKASYTGALYRNGKVFDSSFNRDGSISFQIGTGGVIKGWDEGIEGQKVGSRLLLVVPPSAGYGEAGSGEIKGDDTIVFVVDILAAY